MILVLVTNDEKYLKSNFILLLFAICLKSLEFIILYLEILLFIKI